MVELSLSPESHRPNRNSNNKSNRAVAKKHLRVPDFTGRYHLMRVEKPGSSIKKISAAAKRNKTVGGVNEPVQLLAGESFNKNNNNSKGNNKIGKEELACMVRFILYMSLVHFTDNHFIDSRQSFHRKPLITICHVKCTVGEINASPLLFFSQL